MYSFEAEVQPKRKAYKSKSREGLSKKAINIIRTTQRNNIQLTAIADNKANVLLSLNAIMIAAFVPLIIANLEKVYSYHLLLPLCVLAATCFTTIYLAAKVLKPSKFDGDRKSVEPGINPSPFFFGNFYKMKTSDYYEYFDQGLSEPSLIKAHMAQDLYYIGKRLGDKMAWIRRAFNIFTFGIFLTILSIIFVLFF
jgi:pycsar effector protein